MIAGHIPGPDFLAPEHPDSRHVPRSEQPDYCLHGPPLALRGRNAALVEALRDRERGHAVQEALENPPHDLGFRGHDFHPGLGVPVPARSGLRFPVSRPVHHRIL